MIAPFLYKDKVFSPAPLSGGSDNRALQPTDGRKGENKEDRHINL
jgi:hypothetical protein